MNIYSDKKVTHTTLELAQNALVVDYNGLKPLFQPMGFILKPVLRRSIGY